MLENTPFSMGLESLETGVQGVAARPFAFEDAKKLSRNQFRKVPYLPQTLFAHSRTCPTSKPRCNSVACSRQPVVNFFACRSSFFLAHAPFFLASPYAGKRQWCRRIQRTREMHILCGVRKQSLTNSWDTSFAPRCEGEKGTDRPSGGKVLDGMFSSP